MFKQTFVAAATLCAMSGAASAATIAIDTFGDSQGPVQAQNGGTVADSATTGFALGGSRLITVENAAGTGLTQGEVNPGFGGVFAFSNDALTSGSATLDYALGGVDLTDGGTNDTIVASVLQIDLGMLVGMTIDGVSQGVTVGNTGNLNFAFTDFAGVDFTNVNDIQLSFDANGLPAVDATIDFLGAEDLIANPVTSMPTVPLPAGGLLIVTALAGLGALRRKS